MEVGIGDDLFLYYRCGSCNNNNGGIQVWAIYYPKVGFKEIFHSNKYRLLKASFDSSANLKVEKCGIDLIMLDDRAH